MRTKDLIDLVLLVETGSVAPDEVRDAVRATFARRNSHPLPPSLPEPPARWVKEFEGLAGEAQLATRDMAAAFAVLLGFWDRIRW